jgi:Protein of unknown function (DUF3349)
MALFPVFAKIATRLRTGLAGGPPWHGDVPLLAVLGHPLTDDDVTLIGSELAFAAEPESSQGVRDAIKAITDVSASDYDVARLRSRFAAGR